MWVALLMGAFRLGAVVTADASTEQSDVDTGDPAETDNDTPDPVVPLPDLEMDDAEEEASNEDDPILVSRGVFQGTAGDDIFEFPEEFDRVIGIEISAAAGDDIIDLLDPSGEQASFNSDYITQGTFSGGDGNDTIRVASTNSTVSGGSSDDVIYVESAAETLITGDAGDDSISGFQVSDLVSIEGGAGNDTIDAREMSTVIANGGEDDDQIYITARALAGTGYTTFADGGAGDDTIFVEGEAFPLTGIHAINAAGGTGSDVFDLTFDEGSLTTNTASWGAVSINDFEPSVDMVIVELQILNASFEVTEARLEEDASTGITQLIISYESDTELDRDVSIVIQATGVTWDDITFEGDNVPPVLVP